MKRLDRREFLRQSSVLTTAGATGAWLGNLATLSNAQAQSTSTDYRALVCIFMQGGNDGHNTVVPTDAVSWRTYSATRDPQVMAQYSGGGVPAGATSIALDQASLLKITHRNAKALNTDRTFGLHPQLKKIQALYAAGTAAIVANVGPLVRPVTKMELFSDPETPVPPKLRSHNDQVSMWQSFGPEGTSSGWGGQFMEKLAFRNVNQALGSVGVGANSVWLNGVKVAPYLMSNNGLNVMGGPTGQIFGSPAVYLAARMVASSSTREDVLVKDYTRAAKRTLSSEAVVRQAMPAQQIAPWGTPNVIDPKADPLLNYLDPLTNTQMYNPLAHQLQAVARMIAARNSSVVGARRQVFMVTLGGFDTHGDQLRQHARLMAKLDHAVDFFQKCLAGMPSGDIRSQVTTFTASEFGRSLVNNGDGTDHGWGNHHFVIGGGVKGTEIYGRFPEFRAFDGSGGFFSDQMLQGGVLIPEISVDQMVYTLGKWMGVAEADLAGTTPGKGICPNIGNFPTAERDIGFMV
ncbi:MAG: DUF1501 domain-containing protein [Aquabacterium sp.]